MKRMGVWIDHRHARLFEVSGKKALEASETARLESGAEEVPRSTTGHVTNMPAHGVGGSGESARRHAEHRREHALADYFKRVSDPLSDADLIVILGPGSARQELATALERDRRFDGRPRFVYSADTHMTDAQIAARIAELAGDHGVTSA
ncbi:MAG: hypothetical protein H6812_07780 [Phycisphaeraceae bacterium]|nr:hypothetical protein [Phycisphaeraceae bacterium]